VLKKHRKASLDDINLSWYYMALKTYASHYSQAHLFSSAQNHYFLLFHYHVYFSVPKIEEFGIKNPKIVLYYYVI
jgi:hypothetical protein